MAKQDLLNAALLQLQAKIHEAYAILEASVRADPSESSADTIATAAVRLSQWEGAAMSLRRQVESLLEDESPEQEEPTPVEVEEVPDEDEGGIAINAENSPTFRRSQQFRGTSTQESDES